MTGTPLPVVHRAAADGVATITLDRPRVNAYDIDLMTQLRASVAAVNADPTIAVAILRSGRSGVFSVGADIKAWAANDDGGNQHLVDTARETADAIAGSEKAWIALIAGHALGGGLELALACDLRFGADGDYQLGLPEVRLGLMPGNGGTQRLLRLVGRSRAFELIATGESIGPERALAIGLLDRLSAAESMQAEAEAYARALANGPRQALAAIKRSLREGEDLDLADGLDLERRLSDDLCGTPDASEGFAAAVAKRPAHFVPGDGGGDAN